MKNFRNFCSTSIPRTHAALQLRCFANVFMIIYATASTSSPQICMNMPVVEPFLLAQSQRRLNRLFSKDEIRRVKWMWVMGVEGATADMVSFKWLEQICATRTAESTGQHTAFISTSAGRVAIVTGGNTGIGLVTVRELARHGAKVYMFSRSESRATKAIGDIKKEIPDANLEFVKFDLQSLKSANEAAETFLTKETRLHMLINNAGIVCNGTGHVALTLPFLPLLKQTAAEPNSHVRIVNLTSAASQMAYQPIFTSLETLNRPYVSTWIRYGNSKLTNMLITNELQKRLEGTGIYCLSVHPRIISTDLWLGMDQTSPWLSWLGAIRQRVMLTPSQGALTQLYAATSIEIEEKDLKAAYLVPYGKVGCKTSLAKDKDGKLGGAFMELCEKLIANSKKS
ncbi:NAD(P)-binding protein [Gymnopus androsaceus JB14]|uniref:NAD(P)-binding protein n=1 Tax=Gymnopus androsaceus JB14 TaxID=1447944 RepID=A0A6A4HNM6_9AGAR|nr:NAD(P)-binding protein [Gymnopus androsaceus JB14]